MPLYQHLLDDAKDRFARVDRADVPARWTDTPDQYACKVAVDVVVGPLTDREVLVALTEIFDRIVRAPKVIPETGSFGETLHELLYTWLFDDVLTPQPASS